MNDAGTLLPQRLNAAAVAYREWRVTTGASPATRANTQGRDMNQIQLPLRLKHTPATEAGEASVWQCRHCGACICHGEPCKQAGRCPSCAEKQWASQTLPVSVFCPLISEDE